MKHLKLDEVRDKMELIIKKGNLLDVKCGWILHGCNSRGVQGSGVALAVKKMYPEAYMHYRAEYEDKGLDLGTNNIYFVSDKLAIVNAITQKDFGSDGKRYVSYDAIQSCFEDLNTRIEKTFILPQEIHIPFLGSGLGGGNWEIIKTIIEQTVTYPTTVWVL
jgi:O-acetyl-ADP-ribose deacetylase (regulator of RNase III)